MTKLISIALLFIFLPSCAMFQTAHQQYIGSMNALTNSTATLEELGDRKYTGSAPAHDSYFRFKEPGENDTTIYHYASPSLWNCLCYYQLIVNNKSNVVIGWNFDYGKTDPKKCCGQSG